MKIIGSAVSVLFLLALLATVVFAAAWHFWPEAVFRPGSRSVSAHGGHETVLCPAAVLENQGCPQQANPARCWMLPGDPVEAVAVEGDQVIVRVLAERGPDTSCRLCPPGCLYSMSKMAFWWSPSWRQDKLDDEANERRARERARQLLEQR